MPLESGQNVKFGLAAPRLEGNFKFCRFENDISGKIYRGVKEHNMWSRRTNGKSVSL